MHLLDRPFLPRRRIAAHLRRGEAVEQLVVGRMDGDELALEMGRKLGDLDAVLASDALAPRRNSPWLSAALSRSNRRASQVGICTPL